MIRVSTNGTLRTYRSHLATATLNQFQAMNTVLTRQRFNSFADSPTLATQSFKAHAAYARNQAQQATTENIVSKFEAAASSLQEFADQYSSALASAEQAQNADGLGARQELGKVLTGIAEGMVQTLNAQYGEKFVFAGADGQNAPFELKGGTLYFRGIDVNTTDPNQLAQLASMAKETVYVDVGLGMELDENEQVLSSTAFNASISGIGLLGYGTVGGAANGVPNNIVSIIAELGQLYSNAGSDNSMSATDEARAEELFGHMQESYENFNTQRGEMETRAQFLKSNQKRLESTGDTLQEQYEGLDQVDLADALTTFAYAQYSYNAALRVGNDILSQSFIDYMS